MIGKNDISQVKIKRTDSMEQDGRREAKAAFVNSCENAGVIFFLKITEAVTIDEVLHESEFPDMIIVNKKERFFKWEKRVASNFLRQLLASFACPVFLLGEINLKIERIVLIYQGKACSVYAPKSFFLLLSSVPNLVCELLHGFSANMLWEIASVDKLHELLDCHQQGTFFTRLGNSEKDILTDHLKKLGTSTLAVTGAYRRGGRT